MDLPNKRESHIPLSIPHISGGELAEVEAVLKSGWIGARGPVLDQLELAFSELMHGSPCIGLNSGTSAIHLGLKLLGVKPRDEVICQSLTFAASSNPILYEGAIPLFIDSEQRTWGMDPNILEEVLRARASRNVLPRAVVVVHLFGQSVDLDSILKICSRYEVPVLEDAAESLGALYKGRHPGTFGDLAAFSFNGNKIITGSGGGILIAKHASWIEKAQMLSTQARDQDPLGIANFVHSEIGYNYRLSTVIAGFILGQLKVLEKRVVARRMVFERYYSKFREISGIDPQPEEMYGDETNQLTRHSRWLSAFVIDANKFGMSAVQLLKLLNGYNVESRPVWRPMHTQPLFRKYPYFGGTVAEDLNRDGICLPSSSNLTEEEIEYVVSVVRGASQGLF